MGNSGIFFFLVLLFPMKRLFFFMGRFLVTFKHSASSLQLTDCHIPKTFSIYMNGSDGEVGN